MGIEETRELNELLKEQAKLYNQQRDAIKGQLNLMQQLSAVIRGLNLEGSSRSIEGLNSAVQNAAESVEQLGQGQQTMQTINDAAEEASINLEDLASGAEKFGRKMLKLAPVVATIEGLGSGLQFSMNAMGGLISVGRGLIGTMFNLAASIVSVPFKMLNGLMEMAATGGGTALRQAIEDVRKEFGDLSQNESRAVIKSWRQINHFGGRLAETGLSIWRTMGNMAESLKRVHEMATALGPVFSAFTSEFTERNAVQRMHAYQKGLGLTDEGFRAMGEQAARSGVSIQEMGRRITSVAFAMGESFGINGKLIGREIGNMLNDFEHFGNVGVQELAQVAVYARKLGVEVEKLTGVLDHFANFDKAAESVAQLSQAFGLQLDTLKLVQEQDPAANIERLRKAFFATGRSIETMSRQERALLATHTGLDQKTLSMVFSAQKQGMSYRDITKAGNNAQKQQLSQAEAMQKLSNSIERLVKSGQQLKGGFFDIFLKGFLRGIRRTREFWHLIRNLRRAMRATRFAGIRVGRMFVKHFPGVRDVLKGIGELFDPRRFRKMLRGVVESFRTFFQDMTKNPQQALPVLLEKLKKTFFNWFSSSTPAGRRILNGFKSFFKAVAHLFTGLLKQAIKGTTKMFQFITSTLKDPSKAMKGLGQAQSGIVGFLAEIFSPIINFFKSQEGQAMLQKLWEAFVSMLSEVWKKVQPMVVRAIPGLAAVMFGPSFITGIARGLSAALGAAFVKGIGGLISGRGANAATNKLTEAVNTLTSKMKAGGPESVKGIGTVAKGIADAGRATKRFGVEDAARLGLKLVAMATAISVGGVELAIALGTMFVILRSAGMRNPSDAALPLITLGAAVVSMIAVNLAAKAMSAAQAGQTLVNLVAGATALTVGGVMFAGSLAIIAGVLESAGLTTIEKVGWPLLVLGAAVVATIALALTALTLEPTTLSTAAGMMLYGSLLLAGSGVAFAGALWVVKQSLQKAGMDTIRKAGEPLLILGGAILALIGLSASIMLLAATNPAIIAVGLLNGIILIEVAKMAVGKLIEIKNAMRGISSADIPMIVGAVSAMATIYGATAAFAIAAAGFGLVLASIGGAVGLAVGLVALAEISNTGVKHTKDIISKIRKMPDVPESKLNAFVTVVKALGSFAANVAQIINAATPSFLSLAAMPWGRNPEREAKASLGMVGDIVRAIGSQIKGVIQELVKATRGFSDRQLNAAEKLAPLLNATVELAKAMSANSQLTKGLFGDLLSVQILKTAGNYFAKVGETLVTLLPALHSVMKQIGRAPAIDASKISTFSTFLKSLGPLMQALSPSGGMAVVLGLAQTATVLENKGRGVVEGLGRLVGVRGAGGGRVDRVGQMLTVVRRFARAMLQIITEGGFLKTMQNFMGAMVKLGQTIDPNQLKSVKAVAEIFGNLTGLVKTIAESFTSKDFLKAVVKGPGVDPAVIGRTFSGLVRGIITPLGTWMPIIIEQLKTLSRGMSKSQITRLSSVVGIFGQVVGSISGLTSTVKNLSEGSGDSGNTFRTRVQQIGSLLNSLISGEGGNTIISAIQSLGNARIDPRAKRNAETLSEVLKAAGSIGQLVTSGTISNLAGGGDRVRGIHSFFGHLFNPQWSTGGNHWITHIQEFGRVRLSRNVSRNIEQINSFVSGVSSIDFGMIARQATAAEQIDEHVTQRLQTGINALIENTNNVGRRLRGASRRAFNIDSELQTFANNLGLRSTGRLQIAHQPIQFNVNWRITVDSAEFEKALIEREGSRILTRGDRVG